MIKPHVVLKMLYIINYGKNCKVLYYPIHILYIFMIFVVYLMLATLIASPPS